MLNYWYALTTERKGGTHNGYRFINLQKLVYGI